MRTRRMWSMGVRAVLLACGLLGAWLVAPRTASADIGSDHPAAILVFPKLLTDTANGLDTMIRISNVSDTALNVYCFYVDATPQCSLDQATSCFPDQLACFRNVGGQTIAGQCLAKWQETDFVIRLTQEQPTGWLVSGGESVNCAFIDGVCSNDGTTKCDRDTDCPSGSRCVQPPCLPLDGGPLGRTGPGGQLNEGAVPLSPEDPFIGELKCIAVDESLAPIARNDLIGEVMIGRVQPGPDPKPALAGYNAIGIPAVLNTCQPNGTCSLDGRTCITDQNCAPTNNRDTTLVIGGPAQNAEYEGCPNVLILDHFFDGAVDPLIANLCQPDGTCSVSGTECKNDNDCNDNICLPAGTCSVSGTACKSSTDCDNTCVTSNSCGAGSTCTFGGNACTSQADCPNNFCTLSNEHCLVSGDCTAPVFRTRVVTNLTLVPCTEDFESQQPELSKTTAQYLIYNEYEQRFSTSNTVQCFEETRLSDITGDNARSIFSVGVEGTLTGQTRIRGVENTDPQVSARAGNALLGVAEEFRCGGPAYQFPLCSFTNQTGSLVSATAKNLHFQGLRAQSDFIYLP